MLLAVDVGNTQTHVGLFRDDELVEHWRFHTARTATADELAVVLNALLRLRDLRLQRRGRDDGVLRGAGARPGVRPAASLRYLDGRGALVGPEIKTGMPIRIDNPRELGADRLVNAVAAYERIGGACIAVDFGTALNYDVVSADGRVPRRRDLARDRDLAGGAQPARRRAAQGAARARRARRSAAGTHRGDPVGRGLRLRRPGRRPGRRGMREELGEEATAIATGGFAGMIVPHCEQIDEVDDLLTLTGPADHLGAQPRRSGYDEASLARIAPPQCRAWA